MQHVQPELMQRFLADEADLMERETVTEHLAHCEECAALLVQMAAEDDSLSMALRLDEDEIAWAAAVDVTQPVLQKLRPWYREPVALAVISGILLFAAYMLSQTSLLLGGALQIDGPVGLTVKAVPALWRMLVYIGQGGLLITLLPVLALATVIWLLRSRLMKKEEKTNA